MTARIFISYRSADGMDKATALARDLGAVFGDAQVFLDKDDLRGGSAWRDEVQRTLHARPVLLLLMTPQLLCATDEAGRLRIADPNDPVRREFSAALEAGADIVPLVCDGLDALPAAASLPPPFDQIGERTWRKLRAYDWNSDIQRLVQDLAALGVPRQAGAAPQGSARPRRRRLVVALIAAAAVVAAVLGGVALQAERARADRLAAGLSGDWTATLGADPSFTLVLHQQGDALRLTSVPVPVANRHGWADYRKFWRNLTGTDLQAIVYRGTGTVRMDPGVPMSIDVAIKVFDDSGSTLIDSGNLQAALAADGRNMQGRLWSNGDQAERAIVLQRHP